MSSISKHRISSPLEAGASLLDAKQLPPQLTAALEYVSSRLGQKGLHLSLIVVRKDVDILSLPSPQSPQSPRIPESPTHPITTSPVRSLLNSATSFTKSLNRNSSRSSLKSETGSTTSTASSRSLSRTNWSSLPSSPKDRNASPPASPTLSSPTSPTLSQARLPVNQNPYGITLMHATSLTPKAEKILRHCIAKAEKKYSIGTGWLPPTPLTTLPTCASTTDLLQRSLTQNEILFTSNGLTLLSLDHIYTFKCQLHTYSASLSASDLTLAVDELQRLVLAQNGRRITRGYLVRAYDWLGVSLAALVDVNEGYKTAYGGAERTGGLEVEREERCSPPLLKTSFAAREARRIELVDSRESSPTGSSEFGFGQSASEKGIGFGLSMREDRGPHRRGPLTPNGFDDITPVTKGEWGILMVGEGWNGARLAPVETC